MKFATATSNAPSDTGNCCTSPRCASTPRARVSSTIRSDWSGATTSMPAATRRSANSPRPHPTSSTDRGETASTSARATSCGRGPLRRDQSAVRAESPVSSAYSRRTASESSCSGAGSATRAHARRLVRGDFRSDLLERAPDQTRDVHLRDADLLRDLRLRQPVEETQLKNLPLALVKRFEPRREHRAIFRHLVLALLGADRLQRVEVLVAVAAAAARRERHRGVRTTRLERLEHFFLLRARC